MKQVSLDGLDVSRLGLGAMGMSAFAGIANRGDHALLLSPWLDVLAALLLRSGVPGPSEYEPSRVSPGDRHRSTAARRRIPASHEDSPVPELRRPPRPLSPA